MVSSVGVRPAAVRIPAGPAILRRTPAGHHAAGAGDYKDYMTDVSDTAAGPAGRIVSLLPAATEIVAALGIEERSSDGRTSATSRLA